MDFSEAPVIAAFGPTSCWGVMVRNRGSQKAFPYPLCKLASSFLLLVQVKAMF